MPLLASMSIIVSYGYAKLFLRRNICTDGALLALCIVLLNSFARASEDDEVLGEKQLTELYSKFIWPA